jgi:hypothetical protein
MGIDGKRIRYLWVRSMLEESRYLIFDAGSDKSQGGGAREVEIIGVMAGIMS